MNTQWKISCVIFLFVVQTVTNNNLLGICITNCVQCKKMFGPYFKGKACGDACVVSDGGIFLDCNNPETFVTFLKRFHKRRILMQK